MCFDLDCDFIFEWCEFELVPECNTEMLHCIHRWEQLFLHLNANVHLLSEPPTCVQASLSLSVVSRRGACGATACTAAAAIRYPGSRSPESWREEQHPTPPPPRPPHPRPDTPLSSPCRGSTWSRRAAQRSLLPPWPLPPPALLGTGADLITLPPALQPLPVTSENSAGTQCVTQRGKVPSDPRWRETSVIRNRLLEQESFWMLLWFYI